MCILRRVRRIRASEVSEILSEILRDVRWVELQTPAAAWAPEIRGEPVKLMHAAEHGVVPRMSMSSSRFTIVGISAVETYLTNILAVGTSGIYEVLGCLQQGAY